MTTANWIDIEFVNALNNFDWQEDLLDRFLKLEADPDEVSALGHWAFGNGMTPAIHTSPDGYLVRFCLKDIGRLEQLGVRFPTVH